MRGERERLRQLKASHAGVNAKAWDTSHASLDRELAKFQKFLKSKARRVAEEEVMQVTINQEKKIVPRIGRVGFRIMTHTHARAELCYIR